MTVTGIFETMDYGPALCDDTPAQTWLDAHGRQFASVIKGKRLPAGPGLDSTNPATGEKLATIRIAGSADIDSALDAAKSAQSGWMALTDRERGSTLRALGASLKKKASVFALLESLDTGKPVREAENFDLALAMRQMEHFANVAHLRSQDIPASLPRGVVAALLPWTFPLLSLVSELAPALATGNAIVIQPHHKTPLSALMFADCLTEAGVPEGLVNILTGDATTAEALVRHDDIEMVVFSGATDEGRKIREITAGSGKEVVLRLQGKSPFIVFEDADLDSAVQGVMDSVFLNQGQVFGAGSRLFVQEGIAPTFVARLKARMESLRVGNPLDQGVDMGAMIDGDACARIGALLTKAGDEGLDIWQPGGVCPTDGNFCAPTVIWGAEPASVALQEDFLGPVISGTVFRTAADVVALANNSPFGLTASVWSENITRANGIVGKLDVGTVWINCAHQYDPAVAHGGRKDSGFGKQGGIEGLRSFVKPGAKTTAPILASEAPKETKVDIQPGVTAALKAITWSAAAPHERSAALLSFAGKLGERSGELAEILAPLGETDPQDARNEVDISIARLELYAALASTQDDRVPVVPFPHMRITSLQEPYGVLGIVAPSHSPLLGLVSLVAPVLAMGNRVVAVSPGAFSKLLPVLKDILAVSSLPDGALTLMAGDCAQAGRDLARHPSVGALWLPESLSETAERASTSSLKPIWTISSAAQDMFGPEAHDATELLNRATTLKNVWTPGGE